MKRVFQLPATKNNPGEVNLPKAHPSVTHTWLALVHQSSRLSCWLQGPGLYGGKPQLQVAPGTQTKVDPVGADTDRNEGQGAKFPCPSGATTQGHRPGQAAFNLRSTAPGMGASEAPVPHEDGPRHRTLHMETAAFVLSL